VEYNKAYLVVRPDHDGDEVLRVFLDREEAEEFAANYAQHMYWVEVEEMKISWTAPELDVWYEARAALVRDGEISLLDTYKRVYWSDEPDFPYDVDDPTIDVNDDLTYQRIIVRSRDKMTAESVLSNKVAQMWGTEAEDKITAERKRRALEFGAMFGSFLGKVQE
jgi:hypothetical protein